jgi:hypothetical protein
MSGPVSLAGVSASESTMSPFVRRAAEGRVAPTTDPCFELTAGVGSDASLLSVMAIFKIRRVQDQTRALTVRRRTLALLDGLFRRALGGAVGGWDGAAIGASASAPIGAVIGAATTPPAASYATSLPPNCPS